MGHMALHRAGEKQGPSPESLLEGRTPAPHRPPQADAQQLLRPLVDLGSNSRKLPQSTPMEEALRCRGLPEAVAGGGPPILLRPKNLSNDSKEYEAAKQSVLVQFV